MTLVAFESRLCSVVRSSMYPRPGNGLALWVRLYIVPGLPMQELNVGTVADLYKIFFLISDPYQMIITLYELNYV